MTIPHNYLDDSRCMCIGCTARRDAQSAVPFAVRRNQFGWFKIKGLIGIDRAFPAYGEALAYARACNVVYGRCADLLRVYEESGTPPWFYSEVDKELKPMKPETEIDSTVDATIKQHIRGMAQGIAESQKLVLTDLDFSAHEQRMFDLFSKPRQGREQGGSMTPDPQSLNYEAPNQFICTDPKGQRDDHGSCCRCDNCRTRREVAFLVRKTALERQKVRAEADSARAASFRPFLVKVSSGSKRALRFALGLLLGAVVGGLSLLGSCDVAHTFISPRIDTGRSLLSQISNWEG